MGRLDERAASIAGVSSCSCASRRHAAQRAPRGSTASRCLRARAFQCRNSCQWVCAIRRFWDWRPVCRPDWRRRRWHREMQVSDHPCDASCEFALLPKCAGIAAREGSLVRLHTAKCEDACCLFSISHPGSCAGGQQSDDEDDREMIARLKGQNEELHGQNESLAEALTALISQRTKEVACVER